MSKRAVPQRSESPRFIYQKETIDTLAMAQERLDSLNEDYYDLDYANNSRVTTQPYEGAVLFSIDSRPTDRASTLLHAPSYGLPHERLAFNKNEIRGRRIILSQSALKYSLQDGEMNRDQSFHSSKMNPDNQVVWGRPLVQGKENIVDVQLAYTVNQNPDWVFPSNGEVDKIWEKHRGSMSEVNKSLADLALKTSSLSKSLEIMPPITPNAFVLQWDVVNSRFDALNDRYASQEAYLETWKAARKDITDKLNATVLDRGDGEFIILPLDHMDLNNHASIRQYSKREVLPLVDELIAQHTEIAKAYLPDISKKINVTVGIGNIEEDQDGQPTGQILYELKNLADSSAKPLVFSRAAEEILF